MRSYGGRWPPSSRCSSMARTYRATEAARPGIELQLQRQPEFSALLPSCGGQSKCKTSSTGGHQRGAHHRVCFGAVGAHPAALHAMWGQGRWVGEARVECSPSCSNACASNATPARSAPPAMRSTCPAGHSHSSVCAYFRFGSVDTLRRAGAGSASSRPVMGPVLGTCTTVTAACVDCAGAAAAAAAGALPPLLPSPSSSTSPRKRLYLFTSCPGTKAS